MSLMIDWTVPSDLPVIAPGELHGDLDVGRAGACHVLEYRGRYVMYYWGVGKDGAYRVLKAVAPLDDPNAWQPCGAVLEPVPDLHYLATGPSFPMVAMVDDLNGFMYFGAWGVPRPDGRLSTRTGVAITADGGDTWQYPLDRPVLKIEKPYEQVLTGSGCVFHSNGHFRMYYSAGKEYIDRPEGVRTGHGDCVPRVGIAYAESDDGLNWHKPFDDWMVSPRGFDTEPFEYICSQPCVVKRGDGYTMWVSTFGPAYRIRSLTSDDGMSWTWVPSPPDGDLGVGEPGTFDDHQGSYAMVVPYGDELRMWYTGNDFGGTGLGYAVGRDRDGR